MDPPLLPPFHRPQRPGAGLTALLGLAPRQALGIPTLQREPLGDVLSRSLPKTLPELLAERLGVDPHEQREPQEPEPEVDTAEPEPDMSTAPPPVVVPPLVDSIAALQGRRAGDCQ